MSEAPTIEEMRPLLQPLAAIAAMHALIGRLGPTDAEDGMLLMMERALGCAKTMMAVLNADSLIDEPKPDVIPLDYSAGNAAQDEAVKELARSLRFNDLPYDFKRLIQRAANAIQNHEDQIPF